MAKNWNIIPSLSPAIFLHSCRRAAPALQSERYRESGGLNLTAGDRIYVVLPMSHIVDFAVINA
jgi:hypothetical protein